MKTFKILLFLFTALAAFLSSGCVYIGSEQHSDPAWPKAIAAKYSRQYEGIYQNDSLLAKRDKNLAPHRLFDFLTGEYHAHDKTDQSVEIRFAPDGSILRIRLLDRENRELDSATLVGGKTVALSNGVLHLYGPFSGRHSETSNFGPYTQYQRDKLRLASTGGLLGHASDHEMGLIGYIIPEAMMTRSSMYWPKLAQ